MEAKKHQVAFHEGLFVHHGAKAVDHIGALAKVIDEHQFGDDRATLEDFHDLLLHRPGGRGSILWKEGQYHDRRDLSID